MCVCLLFVHSFIYCGIHPAHQLTTQFGFQWCLVGSGSSQEFPCSSKSFFSKEYHYTHICKAGFHTLTCKGSVMMFCVLNVGFMEFCGWKPLAQDTTAHIPLLQRFLTVFSPVFFLSPSLSFISYWYSEDELWWRHVQRYWPCVLGVKEIIHVYFILLLLCGISVKSLLQE